MICNAQYPNMHLHTKFGIPISKNIGDMHQTQCIFKKLGQRSEVKFKVTVTQLWYVTLPLLKMHPHTKFEIPTSNNIRDMQCFHESAFLAFLTQ